VSKALLFYEGSSCHIPLHMDFSEHKHFGTDVLSVYFVSSGGKMLQVWFFV
jgi:hypothetical protein